MKKLAEFIIGLSVVLVKKLATISIPFTRKQIKGANYYEIKKILQEGDIILTKTYGEFSNLVNPSPLKHGAMYVGNPKEDHIDYVAEALGRGVVLNDLITHILSKDEVVICRLKKISPENKDKMVKFAISKIGLSYDYDFSLGNKAFYCFELCAEAINSLCLGIALKKKITLDKEFYICETFLDLTNFEILYDSRVKK